MKIKSLIDKIESFCERAVNHRYDRRFPAVSFFEHGIDDEIRSYTKKITIKADKKQVKYYHYRLPQTRIFFSQYEIDFLNCLIIEYFDSQIIIFKNEFEGESSNILLKSRVLVKILATVNIELIERNTWQFETSEAAILWVNPPSEKDYKFDDIPVYLNFIKEREYRTNPINQLVCTDVNLVQRIDETWSAISMVGENGNIPPEKISREHAENLYWLQEIFLHLGRDDELSNFYSAAGKKSDFKDVVTSAQQRFENNFSAPANSSEVSFLQLLFSDYSNDENIDQKIQDYWQFISQPFLELLFAEKITKNPDEFIAFALLAFYRNFWWFDKLFFKIIIYLSGQTKILFELLILLKQVASYQPLKRIIIGPGNVYTVVSKLTNKSAGFGCSYIKQNKRCFTVFSYKNSLDFKIDRFINLEFREADRFISISPLICRPPHGRHELNRIVIEVEGYSFQLPLVWDQFEVQLNFVRIKFLRKKNRFQLTVRQRNDFPEIYMNGEKLEFSGVKKLKQYIEIHKRESVIDIVPFTEIGTEITRINPLKNELRFAGNAVDVFGTLRDKVNISFNDSKKSKALPSDQIYKEIIYAPAHLQKYKLSARKCAAVEREIQPADRYLEKFRNTPAHLLKVNLIASLVPELWKEKEKIQQILHSRLGFNVNINKYSGKNLDTGKFILIIGDRTDKKICLNAAFFKIIQEGNSKAFYIEKENIKRIFSSEFFKDI